MLFTNIKDLLFIAIYLVKFDLNKIYKKSLNY